MVLREKSLNQGYQEVGRFSDKRQAALKAKEFKQKPGWRAAHVEKDGSDYVVAALPKPLF